MKYKLIQNRPPFWYIEAWPDDPGESMQYIGATGNVSDYRVDLTLEEAVQWLFRVTGSSVVMIPHYPDASGGLHRTEAERDKANRILDIGAQVRKHVPLSDDDLAEVVRFLDTTYAPPT